MPNATNPDEVRTPKEEKLWNLTIELEKAQRVKKSVVGGHNENIRRIRDEIKELLKEEKELEQTRQEA